MQEWRQRHLGMRATSERGECVCDSNNRVTTPPSHSTQSSRPTTLPVPQRNPGASSLASWIPRPLSQLGSNLICWQSEQERVDKCTKRTVSLLPFAKCPFSPRLNEIKHADGKGEGKNRTERKGKRNGGGPAESMKNQCL